MEGNILKFTTETAWSPCDETFELVCEKFPTLCYFYQSEEPSLAEYWTNDQEGKYFPDQYIAEPMYSRRQTVQGIFCQPDRNIQVV